MKTNKLNVEEDICFQLRTEHNVIKWDFKDNSEELNSFYDMKDSFEEDTEIYKVFDDYIEHEVEVREPTLEELKQGVRDWYDGLGDDPTELNVTVQTGYEVLDELGYVKKWLDADIDYYATDLEKEFFPAFDDELNDTFKFIWANASEEFGKFFEIEEPHRFLNVEGYPDIDDLIEKMESPERLKKFGYSEDTTYDNSDIYSMMEEFLENEGKTKQLVKKAFDERYEGYNSQDLLGDMYGDLDSIKELIEYTKGMFIEDYFNKKLIEKHIENTINNMSFDEMMDLLYN